MPERATTPLTGRRPRPSASCSGPAIAARAGVSKLTVYSHFGDKDALFLAAVESYCDAQVPTALFTPAPDQPLRHRLVGVARAVYALMASPDAVAGFRMMCSQASATGTLWEMESPTASLCHGFAAYAGALLREAAEAARPSDGRARTRTGRAWRPRPEGRGRCGLRVGEPWALRNR